MKTMNRIFLLGYIGANPEIQTTSKGKPYTQLSVATHRRFQGEEGDWTTKTLWHKVSVFGQRAETCAKYLQKGSPVFIEGELSPYMRSDEAGNSHKVVGINAFSIDILPTNERTSPAS